MDEVRIVKNTDQLARFLDGQPVRTSPFGRNSSGEKAYRRAERLVAALHLLTNHVPEGEPARQLIRKQGLILLSDLLLVRDEMRAASMKVRAIHASIREIISLARMLSVSGYVSTQNADVVIEALDDIGNFLKASERSAYSESASFSRDDFHAGLANPYASVLPGAKRQSVSDTRSSTVIKDTKSIKDSPLEGTNRANKTSDLGIRAQAVLQVLQLNGELGIRDVSGHLPEYSEKMVQRELASLVNSRKVKKTGHKRWSKYSVVS